MEENNKDQVVDEIVGDNQSDNQSTNEQSEDTNKEQITLEQVYELAKGLQKGYTLTRQELAELKAAKEAVAEAPAGSDEEYLTVGKFKSLMAEIQNSQQQAQIALDNSLDSQVEQLEAEGIIKSDEDKENLYNYAAKLVKDNIIPPDKDYVLIRAAKIWQEKDEAKREALKEAAKSKVKQEEGSKVGTSQKGSDSEQGVSYEKIKKMDWFGN